MAVVEGKTQSERNKMIAAITLGVIALFALWYAFFSSPSTPTKTANRNSNTRTTTTTQTQTTQTVQRTAPLPTVEDERNLVEQEMPQPIPVSLALPSVPEAKRNIFAFYVPPPPTPKPEKPTPTPTPTPPPPQLLASISPANVFARTGDFKLDVNGDKFTPDSRITIDGSEIPTRFINAQQLSATVPAAFIAGEGARSVSVHTPDGRLYSNVTSLSVMAPPVPNFSFVGILGRRSSNDTAVVQDKNSKDLLNVQRGDIVGGRFRVTSISERELVLTDTTLRIKHTIPFTVTSANSGPQPRPQRPVDDDEEP